MTTLPSPRNSITPTGGWSADSQVPTISSRGSFATECRQYASPPPRPARPSRATPPQRTTTRVGTPRRPARTDRRGRGSQPSRARLVTDMRNLLSARTLGPGAGVVSPGSDRNSASDGLLFGGHRPVGGQGQHVRNPLALPAEFAGHEPFALQVGFQLALTGRRCRLGFERPLRPGLHRRERALVNFPVA